MNLKKHKILSLHWTDCFAKITISFELNNNLNDAFLMNPTLNNVVQVPLLEMPVHCVIHFDKILLNTKNRLPDIGQRFFLVYKWNV